MLFRSNSKDLTHFADTLLKQAGKRAAVFSKKEGEAAFAFVLLSKEKDARELTEEMRALFDCKGGGKPDAVQGKVTAEKAELAAFFEGKGFRTEG